MGGGQMRSYRVCFMNEIPRNDKLFRCCQRSVIVRSAPSADWAIDAAKQQFAQLEGIRDWKIHAGLIEVEAIDSEIELEGLSGKATPKSHKQTMQNRAHKATERTPDALGGLSRKS